ncbi:MAG TPA: type I secretion system permease/ATPase, partial [Burkholderiaceae bacterium]
MSATPVVLGRGDQGRARNDRGRARNDLGRALWTFRREFAWVGVFSLFVNLLMLSPALYLMQVFDRVLLSGNEFTLIALTSVIVVFFLAMAFAEWLRTRLLIRAGLRFDEFLNERVFNANFEANLNRAGHNPVRSFTDLTNLRQFLTGNGVFAFFDTPWTPIYIVVLFLMHPLLGGVSLASLLILCLLAWGGHLVTAPRHELATEGVVNSSTFLASKLRNAETVQAMGMLGNLRRQWGAVYEDQLDCQTRAHRTSHRVQAVTKFVQYSQQSIILAAAAWLVIRGELTIGAMIAANMLMNNAMRPIGTLVVTWKQFVDARRGYVNLEALLREHPERTAGRSADQLKGQITLEGLVATAPKREQPILRGLDAVFRPGEVVAIVGPSGAGKSTLARCLIGIWPQTEGAVLLDGHPIEEWSREELGPRIGYLPQDIELFDGTLAQNIARFGEVDSAKVIEAAQRTGIHDMILRLPMGYDTPMGVAGRLLSGGQRQRVGLARAVYGDPQVVVLDEPNANLDDVGIAALANTIGFLKSRGTTVFMVVHAQNLLAVADRVLVLNDGAITQL